MVCAQKGYPLVVVMGENFSIERRRLMRFLGAKVVLTPAHLRGLGMQNGRVLYQKRLARLNANASLNLSREWVEKVDYRGEPVKLVLQA